MAGNFDPRIHVPGVWRCAKCSFRLIQSNLNAQDGTVTARDEGGTPCPNCAVPLWRVTWREEAEDARRLEETIWERGLEAGKRYALDQVPCRLCALGFAPFKAERIMWHQVNSRDPFRCTEESSQSPVPSDGEGKSEGLMPTEHNTSTQPNPTIGATGAGE